jgi:hypothetical protein
LGGEHGELDALDEGPKVLFGDGIGLSVGRHDLALFLVVSKVQAFICASLQDLCSASCLYASVRWLTELDRCRARSGSTAHSAASPASRRLGFDLGGDEVGNVADRAVDRQFGVRRRDTGVKLGLESQC